MNDIAAVIELCCNRKVCVSRDGFRYFVEAFKIRLTWVYSFVYTFSFYFLIYVAAFASAAPTNTFTLLLCDDPGKKSGSESVNF